MMMMMRPLAFFLSYFSSNPSKEKNVIGIPKTAFLFFFCFSRAGLVDTVGGIGYNIIHVHMRAYRKSWKVFA
jgi:hypothetical protein